MKSIIEKARPSRRFISPSLASDITAPASTSALDWKTPAALLAGAWFFKKFPKTSIVGLLAAGVYYGMTMNAKKETNPFRGEGIAKDLH